MSTAERLAERIEAIMKLVDEFGSARLHAQKYPVGKGAQSYVKNVRAEIERSLGLLATPADGGGQGVTPLISGSTVVSAPGAVLEVTQVHLTEAGKAALSVAHGIGTPASTGGERKEQPLNGQCQADRDGDCVHSQCPQLRDGEPDATGRHCPLDGDDDDA